MMLARYKEEIAPKLTKEFDLKNPMAAPKVVKVVVNMGIGDVKGEEAAREKVVKELAQILGQRPSIRRARAAVAGFGIRRGDPVGLVTTLRGKRMYSFLEKLVGVVLPRLRDFKGVSKDSFDGRGNYTLGIGEHTVFPEIDLGKVGKARGLEITIVTTTQDSQKARRLLEELGMPFEK